MKMAMQMMKLMMSEVVNCGHFGRNSSCAWQAYLTLLPCASLSYTDNEGGAHDDDSDNNEDGPQFHNKMVMVEMFMSNLSNCCREDNYTKLTGESRNITLKQDW